MSNTSNGGRVTTREFYEALIEQNALREDANKEINDKLDGISSAIASGNEKFIAINDKIDVGCARLDKRIDKTEKGIEKVRNLNTFIALLGSTIAGIIGVQK